MLNKTERKENQERITRLLKSTGRAGIEELVDYLETSDYFEAPASSGQNHGGYAGGLAHHSYLVYEEFQHKVDRYNLNVPEESAIIAGLCHDLCKVDYYKPNTLKDGSFSKSKPYVTQDDFPLGHGEKSVAIAQRYIELTNQEAMLIRWHMGNYDPAWEFYARKIEERFPEVLAIHHADNEVAKYHGV